MTRPNDIPPPPPRKRRWFRRSAEASPTTTICPVCNVAGPARLLAGQPCQLCQTQEAWNSLGASGLVIDHGAIDQALQRRRGEAAGEPLWKKLIVWAPPAATLGMAGVAAWCAIRLLSSRALGPLGALLEELVTTSKRTTLVGLLTVIVGAIALFRLRRQRHFRRLPIVLGHSVAIVIGASALVVGGLHLIEASLGGFSGQYTSMPAREAATRETSNAERILNATVVVLAPDAQGDARNLAIGTGAIVAADDHRAWIVTCSHVAMPYAAVGAQRHARDAQPVWVQLSDGREGQATVRWAAPPLLDVVLIEFRIEHPPEPVTISIDASSMQPSASVTFVPNPYRSGWKVVHGELLQRETHHTSAGTFDLLLTSLPVTYGDSGSGLFDARGQLVGLNTWTRVSDARPAEGISLPSETMRALVDAIHSGNLDKLDDSIAIPTTRE